MTGGDPSCVTCHPRELLASATAFASEIIRESFFLSRAIEPSSARTHFPGDRDKQHFLHPSSALPSILPPSSSLLSLYPSFTPSSSPD